MILKKKLLQIFMMFGIGFFCAYSCNAASSSNVQSLLFKSDFEKDEDVLLWSAWSTKGTPLMNIFSPGYSSDRSLRFSTANLKDSVWNTPSITFAEPIVVSSNTVIFFKMKFLTELPHTKMGLNIDVSNKGQYFLLLNVDSDVDGWYTFSGALSEAVYKRGGMPGFARDELVGDKILGFQIANYWSDVLLDNVQIVNLLGSLPLAKPLIDKEYQLKEYPILNQVFPFGPLVNVMAEAKQGELFGQTGNERIEDFIVDIKRNYMNVYCNFCETSDIDFRMSLLEKYNMFLIETTNNWWFGHSCLAGLPEDHNVIQEIKRYADNKHILVWYGSDEVSGEDALRNWVNGKIALAKYGVSQPMSSCFNEIYHVKQAGKYAELIMWDNYCIAGDQRSTATISHADGIRVIKKYCAGNKVWLVTQGYGDRVEGLRFPVPEEIRFDVFNSLTAGVNGVLFYIYNAVPKYFIESYSAAHEHVLVDPWLNPSPTYNELSKISKVLVPVMPSLQDAKEIDASEYKIIAPESNLTKGVLCNKYGVYVIFANKDLYNDFDGVIKVSVPEGMGVYDLIKLEPISTEETGVRINIEPGGGEILMLASNDNYKKIAEDIMLRQIKLQTDVLRIDVQLLKEAKVNVTEAEKLLEEIDQAALSKKHSLAFKKIAEFHGAIKTIQEANSDYWQIKNDLERVRRTFGEIHSMITIASFKQPEVETRKWLSQLEGNSALDLVEKLRLLSVEYYKIRRQWMKGDFSCKTQLDSLACNAYNLKSQIQQLE